MTKTGKQYMNDFLATKGMSRLTDLKVGDKFYSMDYNEDDVYELLSLTVIHGDEDFIEYQRRKLRSQKIEHLTIQGQGMVNRMLVCKFKGRDRGSFIAGFKAAMRVYQKYMQVFDKENAGLDNSFQSWMTMREEYRNWMK